MKSHSSNQLRAGSALISTLLMIVVLTIIVVAFLRSMTLERQTARSYKNKFQAELAAQAAQAEAIAILENHGLKSDDFSVIQTNYSATPTAKPPYYFVARGAAGGSASTEYTPLISGANPQLIAKPMGQFPKAEEIFDPANDKVSATEPRLPDYQKQYYGGQSPQTRWVSLADNSGTEVARYCYWVEDLQGRLDIQWIGNNADGGKHLRGAELGSSDKIREIALFTLFDKDAQKDGGDTDASTVMENRPNIFSGATIKQLDTSIDATESSATDPLLHLYSGLGFEATEPEVIPSGFGYVSAGQPKIALNDILDSPDALAKIVDAISTNLPQFASTRAGGMDPAIYLNNLAASIIDYVDADGQATTDGSTYRGLDAYPLLTQWYMMTAYTSRSASSATLVNRHFIEIWNMSDKLVSGQVRLEPTNGYTVIAGGSVANLANPGSNVSVASAMLDKNVSLQSNQKAILDMGTETYTITTSAFPSDKIATSGQTLVADYALYWADSGGGSFKLVDKPGGKVWGQAKSFELSSGTPDSKSDWNHAIPGLIYRTSNATGYVNGNVGDPRAAYYIKALQDQNAYGSNAVVGGRTVRFGLQGRTYGEVRPSFWTDPGFDEDEIGNRIGSVSKTPTATSPAGTRQDYAMVHYGNYSDSKYLSITELGHIYDPGLWKIYPGQDSSSAGFNAARRKGLSDITAASVIDGNFGGGYTLRIGRPEFSKFDEASPNSYTAKARAGDLLGIFSTEANSDTRGLLNINTASRDALRALGAGIKMTGNSYDIADDATPFSSFSDPPTIYGPVTGGVEADAFADAVISGRPFFSRHELATRLRKTPGKSSDPLFWGNPEVWSGDSKPTAWRDAAAEEYLRQIYDLTTVKSRNFRIHVTGQALDVNGRVVGTSRKISDVYLRPVRNSSSAINDLKIETLYETSL